jgi:ribosomal protein S18 acetylase RimI-like enzyme
VNRGEQIVRVVQLASDDWPRLRAIRLRALKDAPDAFSGTFEAFARTPEGWAKQVREMPTFVAVRNGIDIGVVRVAHDDVTPRSAWLLSMWVAPEERNRGVGATLVDTVIDYARASGVERVLLDVADLNEPAIALYRRKGFDPNGDAGTFAPPREHVREHRRQLRLR